MADACGHPRDWVLSTHVAVPLPPDVAREVSAVANGNATYVFWSGVGDEESATKNWAKYLARLFDDAKITSGHNAESPISRQACADQHGNVVSRENGHAVPRALPLPDRFVPESPKGIHGKGFLR